MAVEKACQLIPPAGRYASRLYSWIRAADSRVRVGQALGGVKECSYRWGVLQEIGSKFRGIESGYPFLDV